jgi:hypothetical protein
MLRTLKKNGGYKTEFAGSTQNPIKINGTPNLPTRTKIFPKKSMFSSLKVKKSQTKFAPGAQKTTGLKLSSKNLNLNRRSV